MAGQRELNELRRRFSEILVSSGGRVEVVPKKKGEMDIYHFGSHTESVMWHRTVSDSRAWLNQRAQLRRFVEKIGQRAVFPKYSLPSVYEPGQKVPLPLNEYEFTQKEKRRDEMLLRFVQLLRSYGDSEPFELSLSAYRKKSSGNPLRSIIEWIKSLW